VGDQLTDVDLVAVTSHEMRTPLAAIRGFTHTLQTRRDELTGAEIDEFLAVISQQTDRLVQMVDDLLAMSRLEAGTMPLDPQSMLVVPFLRDVISGLGDQRSRIDLRITTDLPPAIEADPKRLRQILTNLLQNALKYSDADRPVTIACDGAGNTIVFDVIDRGPGIDPSEVDRIFEPFYRGETRREGDGAGLGLAITRRLATAMGGRVDVASTTGAGSLFRVTLPRHVAASAPAPPS
jgi:two-component system, OmpR family, sensor histidine kinase KdpD